MEPGINLVFERPHRTCLRVNVSVDGQAFTLLPTLGRAYLSTQINGDFLPGVQAVSAWIKHRSSDALHLFAVHYRHRLNPSLVQPAFETRLPLCLLSSGPF